MVERGAYDAVALGSIPSRNTARLAQLVERTAFNRMVVGSSPTVGTLSKLLKLSLSSLSGIASWH